MGNNSLYNTEKNLRSIAKRYENVKYSVGLAVLFLMKGTSAFSDENKIQEVEKQKEVITNDQIAKSTVKEVKKQETKKAKTATQKLLHKNQKPLGQLCNLVLMICIVIFLLHQKLK